MKAGIIGYGLGKDALDGRWHSITRDIEQDIKKVAPQFDIASISTILVRGNGAITDIKLLVKSPLEVTQANEWEIFDNDPSGAEVKRVNDTEKGNVTETSGEGLLNGYKYSGQYGSIESEDRPFITWDMKFDQLFEVITLVQTDTIARYIHYVPKAADYVEQKDGDLYIGLGETTTDNRWHTITRDLTADVKLINKDAKYVFCKEVLLRGSGKIGNIAFSHDNNDYSFLSSASAVASIVLGQFDFSHNLKNLWDVDSKSMIGLNNPYGVVVGTDNVLYVSDTNNNRILIWDKIPKSSAVQAEIVFYPDKLKRPTGLFVTDKLFFVADTDNDRVLVFKLPVDELSKPLMEINNLKSPRGVFYDGVKLFIADTGNNRVLVWNSFPAKGTTPFDVVLGQSSIDKFDSNRGRGKSNFNTMFYPSSIYSDGKSLYVSDTGNNRIIVFNQIPTMNGWHADGVIGQKDFESNEPNRGDKKPSSKTMNHPGFLTIDNGRLFVSDGKNNRVLIFNNEVKENNSAEGVIGQYGFGLASINGPRNMPGPGTLFLPGNVCIHDGVIFIADSFNNRVLIY